MGHSRCQKGPVNGKAPGQGDLRLATSSGTLVNAPAHDSFQRRQPFKPALDYPGTAAADQVQSALAVRCRPRESTSLTAAIDDRRLDLYSLEFKRAWKLGLLPFGTLKP